MRIRRNRNYIKAAPAAAEGTPMLTKRTDEPPTRHRRGLPKAAPQVALVEGEHLVLSALRIWLEGPASEPLLQGMVMQHCGFGHVVAVAESFERFARTLSRHSRRTLHFHRLRCREVSAGERSLLALVAAFQAGDDDHARALVGWLVPADAADELSRDAWDFAAALRRSGQVVPVRVSRPVLEPPPDQALDPRPDPGLNPAPDPGPALDAFDA